MAYEGWTTEELIRENTELRKQILILEHKLQLWEEKAAGNTLQPPALPGGVKTAAPLNQATLNAMPDTIFRTAEDGTILEFSGKPIAQRLRRQGEMLGRNVKDVLQPQVAEQMLHFMQEALRTGVMQSFEYQTTETPLIQYREMCIVATESREFLAIVRDITDRKTREEELHQVSLHDPLTNLFNRAYFHKIVHQLKDEQENSLGILVCDIDGLKLVNDTFGHQEGDTLLAAAADVISRSIKSTDTAARIGGDEFVIIMPNCTEDMLQATSRKIEDGVTAYNAAKPQSVLSISLGVALDPTGSCNMLDLFKIADDRMYLEKLQRSRSTRSALIQTLKQALEKRDFINEGHGERMQTLVQTLAKAMGVPEHQLPAIRLFAQFHDIGKVGIPDQILFKPGPLTPEEMKIVRSHSEVGYRIAQSSPDLSHLADWILKHHEWWNGQGYPLGLAGDNIPLECRILTLADAYDAMTSDRPYRQAMSHEEAIIKLKKEARGQFDPYLIDMFVELFE